MRVVWIVGQAYCGSTLLNLLLNTQPRVAGIGEGWQVWRSGRTDAPCTRCLRPVNDCDFYRDWQGGPFYHYCLDRYRAHVVVDASKSAEWLLAKPFEPAYEHRVIVLSKAPHEAAWSLIQHARHDTWDPEWEGNLSRFRGPLAGAVDLAYGSYFAEYREHLQCLHTAAQICNTAIRAVTYRDLATRPEGVIAELCDWIGVQFSVDALRADLWRTQTHIVGGNPAILSEVTQDALPVPCDRSIYLGGKYPARRGRIEYDDTWTEQAGFLAECRSAYRRWSEPLGWLLPQLGQSNAIEA